MKQRNIGFALLTCSALLGLSLTISAWATDAAKLVESCISCHGKDGTSTEPDLPNIGGHSVTDLTYTMTVYRDEGRPCREAVYLTGDKKGNKTDMCQVVKEMSDSDINQVAEYFSKQKLVRTAQIFDPVLAQKGKQLHEEHCEKCHSKGGTVADDDAGILGGQKMSYLDEQIKFVNEGKRRTPKMMKAKLKMLDKAGIDALINYYGSFK